MFKTVLPFLKPSAFKLLEKDEEHEQEEGEGAAILGAHVEGPFLAPSKKGAHDAANMHVPSSASLETVYGEKNLEESIKIVTLAPELPGSVRHIERLTKEYGIQVSMGHSAATFEEGSEGMIAGARMLTHTFNAMVRRIGSLFLFLLLLLFSNKRSPSSSPSNLLY